MNEDALQDDPFSPTALDEATELRALSQALRLAQGFKLIFVRCNQSDQRNRLVARLRTELPSLNIQEILLTEPLTNLLDELRKRIKQPTPDAVFVSGLEYSMPNAEDAHSTPLVANLNASRNSFPDVIPGPLVLWVPEYVLNAITLGAPDFFSIRSGVYFFASDVTETADIARALTVGHESALGNLTREEKEERIKAIESLLADYQALPAEKRDRATELRLRLRLANTLFLLGSIAAAKRHYQKLLAEANEFGDKTFVNWAFGSLGLIAEAEGSLSEAESYFRHSLEISRQINDRAAEAALLINLGNIYLASNKPKEAEEAFRKSLTIARQHRARAEEAGALHNVGVSLARQDKLSEAEEYFRQSIDLAREIGQRDIENEALSSLGILYGMQGRSSEAQQLLEESLSIASHLGERERQWRAAQQLSLLREQQDDITGAVHFQRQAVRFLEMLHHPKEAEARERLAMLERKAKDNPRFTSQPA